MNTAYPVVVERTFIRLRSAPVVAALLVLALGLLSPVHAMKIQSVKSPGGIEAWLVEEHSVPLMALRFSFDGGSTQDPQGREGAVSFITSMLDEGAGDLDALAFQGRMEDLAMRMSFSAARDHFYGNFETLSSKRDESVELLRLAVTKPRLEPADIERIRGQILSSLTFAEKNPNRVADNAWNAAAFPGHVYGRRSSGTLESVKAITRDDLVQVHKRQLARDTLKVVAVGDIDAKTLGALLDRVFGELPAKADLTAVPPVKPKGGSIQVIEMPVPQSVAIFGLPGMARKDPDFVAAFVMNEVLGGGSALTSRLTDEVREKRGLAYSVYSYLAPYRRASLLAGGVATKNEQIGTSLEVIRDELKRMAQGGVTAEELDDAKGYLTGSYALRFDSNSKIASQLLGILQEGLGIDYVERRNAEISAVTLADVARVAKRLLVTDDLLVTVVGQPKGLPAKL